MFGGFDRDPGELQRTPGNVKTGPLESPRSG